ncbi:hypothetical protein [uncultured Cetobacterium sp.]|uniref:hypothetical protein n=1 Tax=uncultured Cetobacterium sp. TaxID=527638 RepID=UPI0026266FE5|nr:hypothetical protein [uncultured Cetobacterium sp.]
MLTYSEFINCNDKSKIEIKIYDKRVEVIKPKNSLIKEFEHNFNECLNNNLLENLLLDIIIPKTTSYKVKIRYREERKESFFNWKRKKKWFYTIKTIDGESVDSGEIKELERILEENIDIKEKIIKVLLKIKFKKITKCFETKNKNQQILLYLGGKSDDVKAYR